MLVWNVFLGRGFSMLKYKRNMGKYSVGHYVQPRLVTLRIPYN